MISVTPFILHTPEESIRLSAFVVPRIGEEVIFRQKCYVVTNVIHDADRFQTESGATVIVTPKAG